MRYVKWACLFAVAVLSSCVKDKYDFENMEGTIDPTMAIPLIKTEIKAESILSAIDTTTLKEDPNGLLKLVFSDTLFSSGIEEFVTIPDESLNKSLKVDSVKLDDLNVRSGLKLSTVANGMQDPVKSSILNNNGASVSLPASPDQSIGTYNVLNVSEFSNITLSSGQLQVTLTNQWPIDITKLSMELKNTSDNSIIDTLHFTNLAANGGSQSDVANLAGKTLTNNLSADIYLFATGASAGNVTINHDDSLIFDVALANLYVVSGSAILPSGEVFNDTLNNALAFSNGEEITTLTLKDGDLEYNINYGVQEDANIRIVLPDAKKNGVVFDETIAVSPSSPVATGTFPLDGYTFDLTAGGTTNNSLRSIVIASLVSSGQQVPFDTSHKVVATIDIKGLKPSYIEGYFGQQSLGLTPDSVDFDLGGGGVLGEMSFVEPSVSMNFYNSFGAEMDLTKIDFSMKDDANNEVVVTGLALPFKVGAASTAGQTETSVLTIAYNNTNIEDAINLPPSKTIYDVDGQLNPNGKTTNFATDSSKLTVSMDVSIPLYGSIKGYHILDTIEFGGDIFEQIESGILRSNINNGFPIEGAVTLYFTDSAYTVLDSLGGANELVIAAASVDSNGDVVNNTEKRTDFELTSEMTKKLKNGKHVIVKARLSTENQGAVNGKIYSTQTMEVKLGVLAKVKLDLFSDEEE